MGARVTSVNTGKPIPTTWQRGPNDPRQTGIDKRPVDGRVRATSLGIVGDAIVNVRHHGGSEQALYAYAREHAAWWEQELDRELPPGSFGENLSTEGIDIDLARIGERWAIGDAVVEVTKPRIPCSNFAGFWAVPDLVKRFGARGTPGAYLKVVTEGDIGAGDALEVVYRPDSGLTVIELFNERMRRQPS